MGSIAELETQFLLSADLGFVDNQAKDKLLEHLDEIGRMLRGLDKSLSSRAKD
jgi:four helix bundle protein